MTTFDLILFDLDGTLTDSAPGIIRSVQYALRKMDLPADDPEQFRSFIGPPLVESFRKYLKSDDAAALRAVSYYREYYTRQGILENSVFPGIPELLADLRGAGKTLALATSKPTVYTERILDHFQLRDYFAIVVGASMDEARTAKKDIIADVLARAEKIPRNHPVMVGDRMHDIVGAHLNHIPVIAVTWGYATREELDLAKPDYIVTAIPDLLALLTGNVPEEENA